MASSVNAAFAEFLRDTVNLDPDQTKTARSSWDWLKEQLNALPDRDADFPLLVAQNHIDYGSFARRTKIRPLDDIDLMICLHAQGSTYAEYADRIEITAGPNADRLKKFCHQGENLVNSIRVVNQFIKSLGAIKQYKKADIKRNLQAAVLNLSSYDWNYDIVPCFITSPDNQGKTFYLIPNGKGHWMKTDPRLDREQAKSVNQKHGGHVLDVLRLLKYWNKRRITHTMPSYLAETIILDYYDKKTTGASQYPDLEIADALDYVARAVQWVVNDPKGIQGNLNLLTSEERQKITEAATHYAREARVARQHERNGDQKASIQAWQIVFGSSFPNFD